MSDQPAFNCSEAVDATTENPFGPLGGRHDTLLREFLANIPQSNVLEGQSVTFIDGRLLGEVLEFSPANSRALVERGGGSPSLNFSFQSGGIIVLLIEDRPKISLYAPEILRYPTGRMLRIPSNVPRSVGWKFLPDGSEIPPERHLTKIRTWHWFLSTLQGKDVEEARIGFHESPDQPPFTTAPVPLSLSCPRWVPASDIVMSSAPSTVRGNRNAPDDITLPTAWGARDPDVIRFRAGDDKVREWLERTDAERMDVDGVDAGPRSRPDSITPMAWGTETSAMSGVRGGEQVGAGSSAGLGGLPHGTHEAASGTGMAVVPHTGGTHQHVGIGTGMPLGFTDSSTLASTGLAAYAQAGHGVSIDAAGVYGVGVIAGVGSQVAQRAVQLYPVHADRHAQGTQGWQGEQRGQGPGLVGPSAGNVFAGGMGAAPHSGHTAPGAAMAQGVSAPLLPASSGPDDASSDDDESDSGDSDSSSGSSDSSSSAETILATAGDVPLGRAFASQGATFFLLPEMDVGIMANAVESDFPLAADMATATYVVFPTVLDSDGDHAVAPEHEAALDAVRESPSALAVAEEWLAACLERNAILPRKSWLIA